MLNVWYFRWVTCTYSVTKKSLIHLKAMIVEVESKEKLWSLEEISKNF